MPVLVVDSRSQDDTAVIARARGAQVVVRPFDGFVVTRRAAQAMVRTPWTLMIDADERLDDALREAIARAPGDCNGYLLSRSTRYCGRALRMWRGERLLRLFRTNGATLVAAPAAGGSAQLHERWICSGETPLLDGTLLHDSYPTREAYAEKFARYTAIEAAGMRRSIWRALLESALVPVRFAWYALRRAAVLDGVDGLRVAWSSARYPAVVHWKAR